MWIGRHVLPHEADLRTWLASRRIRGLDIDDVVQETYAVLSRRPTVDDIRNPKHYLFQVAYSIALKALQRARVVDIRAVESLEAFGLVAPGPSAEQRISDRQELHRVAAAIASLKQPDRDAVTLRFIGGLSQREVGARLGISETAAQKHIARAIKKLSAMFTGGGNPHSRGSIEGSEEILERHVRAADQSRD